MGDSLLLFPEREDDKKMARSEVNLREKHKKWIKENNINFSKYVRYKIEEDMKKDRVNPIYVKRDNLRSVKISDEEEDE